MRGEFHCLCHPGCEVAQVLHCRVKTAATLDSTEREQGNNFGSGGALSEVGKKAPVFYNNSSCEIRPDFLVNMKYLNAE